MLLIRSYQQRVGYDLGLRIGYDFLRAARWDTIFHPPPQKKKTPTVAVRPPHPPPCAAPFLSFLLRLKRFLRRGREESRGGCGVGVLAERARGGSVGRPRPSGARAEADRGEADFSRFFFFFCCCIYIPSAQKQRFSCFRSWTSFFCCLFLSLPLSLCRLLSVFFALSLALSCNMGRERYRLAQAKRPRNASTVNVACNSYSNITLFVVILIVMEQRNRMRMT